MVFGEAAELIQKAITSVSEVRSVDLHRVNDLKEAVIKAAEIASAGDVVLLSPGGTSYDAFKDFAERGDYFIKWVQELS